MTRAAACVLLLLLAFGLRVANVGTQSLWFDEGWSAYAAGQPTLVDAFNADATNPPLYYGLLHLFASAAGTSELALRYFSLLGGLLVCALTYRLAANAAGGRAGLGGLALAACSAPLWWASGEARMYTLLAALVGLCAWALGRLSAGTGQRSATYRHYAVLLLAELALLYTHNTGPVIVLWLNAAVALVWLARLLRRAPRPFAAPDWRAWLAGQLAVGVLWLPYFVTRFAALGGAEGVLVRRPPLDFTLLAQLGYGFWGFPAALSPTDAPVLLTGGALLCAVLLALLNRRDTARALALLLHAALLTAGVVAGLVLLGNELHPRYLVMALPLLLAGVAALLSVQRGTLSAAALLALCLGGVWGIARARETFLRDDARAMTAYYGYTLSDPADTVLVWSYANRYDLAYYWERYRVRARRVVLPEGQDLEAIAALLPASGDVALNVWYTQRADYRGMLDCVLSASTAHLPERFGVQGMDSLLYRDVQRWFPALRPLDADFGVARLLTAGTIPAQTADRALCLPLNVRLITPTTTELKASVRVYNDLGWAIAGDDAIFADAAQRTSVEASAGDLLTAYALLRLPPGAPPGTYTLDVRVYDDARGYGDVLALGRWDVPPGAVWVPSNGAQFAYGSVLALGVYPDSAVWRNAGDLPLDAGGALPLDAAGIPRTVPPVRDGGTLRGGERLRLALLWDAQGVLPALTLSAADGAWTVDIPVRYGGTGVVLDWREVRVPADAPTGDATLRLPDGTPLMRYRIESVPFASDLPPFALPIGVALADVGALVGATPPETVTAGVPFDVTLVWRVLRPAARDFTVFVQLVSDGGVVLAQSDAPPAGGARPTMGWRADEIIVDTHTLRWNATPAAGTRARWFVGMYDPATGARVALADGGDAIVFGDVGVR